MQVSLRASRNRFINRPVIGQGRHQFLWFVSCG